MKATAEDRGRTALMDYGEGSRHGDPLRHRLGSPNCRFALGIHLPPSPDGQQVIWLVDEFAELVDGGSSRGKTAVFAQIVGQLIGRVKELQTETAGLRTENAALQDEVQSLASQLDQAREGRIGGVA